MLYNDSHTISKKGEIYNVQKKLLICTIFFTLCVLVMVGCTIHQKEQDNLIITSDVLQKAEEKYHANAASIFDNLSISSFSVREGNSSAKMSCVVKNHNSNTISGYIRVNFYDDDGELMYNQLMEIPAVASGEKVTCSAYIPKSSYPEGYSTVDYTQANLITE